MAKKLNFGKTFAYALKLFKNLVDYEFWSNTYLAWLLVIITNLLVVYSSFFVGNSLSNITKESFSSLTTATFYILQKSLPFILAIILLIIIKVYLLGWIAELIRVNKRNFSWKLKSTEIFSSPKKKFVEGLKLALSFLLFQIILLLSLAIIVAILFGLVYLFTNVLSSTSLSIILMILAILMLIPISILLILIYSFVKIYFAHNFIVKGNFSKSISFAWYNLRNKEFWKGFIVLLLPAILLGIIFYILYFVIYLILLAASFKYGATSIYMPYFTSFLAFIEYITFIFQMHLITYIRKQIGAENGV